MPHTRAMAVAPVDSRMELSRKRGTPLATMSLMLLHTQVVGRMCRKYMSVVSALLRKAVISMTKNG